MAATTLFGERPRFEGGLHELAPGVRAWLQPNGLLGESNAGLISGDGASLLVDTLWDHVLTARMLDAMAEPLRGAPLTTVVNTHSDGDHCWGNALVPHDAEIVTSQASLEVMRTEEPHELVRFQRLAGTLARLPGPPGQFGRYVRWMLGPYAFDAVVKREPTRAFTGTETLDVGGREVRLIEVGPAHTPGDLVVHVPDAGVVFAADILFVGTTPVMWAGPVERWLRALDTLEALGAQTYVPGHGPPCGPEAFDDLRAYWRFLEAEAIKRHAAGVRPAAAARDIFRSAAFREGPWAAWDAPERIAINVATIFRNLDGGPPLTGPVDRIRVFATVSALARERGWAPAAG